jgi:exosortase
MLVVCYPPPLHPMPVVSQTAEFGHMSELKRSEPPPFPSFSLWKALVLLGLVVWLYASVLAHLAIQWWHDPNFSHGFFVPAFALYLVWLKRDALRKVRVAPSWYGVPIVICGLMLLVLGDLGAELFLSRFSFLIVVAGLIVSFLGWPFQKAVMFPWLFLILMIPIPVIVFNKITFPLQTLAAELATAVLRLVEVPVMRVGHIIYIPEMPLEVAQACSGIRSLLSLTTLAIIYGYLMETSVTVRVVLAVASIPIAVAANSLRIVGTGLVVRYWNPEMAEGFFHTFSGWLIFVVSLAMLFMLHKMFRLLARGKVASW